MDSGWHITYRPRPDATPEGERAALAAVYRFILNRHVEKKAAKSSGGEDAKQKVKQ